jgi:hypothetical protein
MPAQSKSQQRLFGMALAQKRGKVKGASKKVKELAASMPEKKLRDFAKTARKGLKEHRALTFRSFLNEAYVDSEGELRDFEFTPDEEFEIGAFEDIQSWKEFLRDSGAYSIRHDVDGKLMRFYFSFDLAKYAIVFDLDGAAAGLYRMRSAPSRYELLHSSELRDFVDSLKIDGLEAMIFQ